MPRRRGATASVPAETFETRICAEQNLLLSALCRSEFEQVTAHGQEVALEAKTVIYRADELMRNVYFICDGIVSVNAEMQDGRTAEVISIGREGMVGLATLMGLARKNFRATVTVSGGAWRLPAEAIAGAFRRDDRLGSLLRRYTQARIFQVSQLTACNLLHSVEQRLARWLLTAHDQLGRRPIAVTHETISDLLGAQRSTISATASSLDRAGLISYTRGQITITDRAGLLATACECYHLVRQRMREVVAP